MKTLRIGVLLSTLALLACAAGAKADMKITVGVGHMCCGSCKKDATAALDKVASDVNIDGKNITMTLKGDDVVVALTTLRNAGFPPLHVDAGGAPVTIAVGHMCCQHCITDLKTSLVDGKIAALNTDDMTIGMGKMVIKARAGMTLDLIPVLNAMEAGGFSATKITMEKVAVHVAPKSKTLTAKNTTKAH